MKLSPYETFCLYQGVKLHFSSSTYCFVKYNGKIRTNSDSFDQRKDRFQFQKLSKLYSAEEMKDFLVANFLKGKSWIGDFLDDEANDAYLDYLRRKQSLTYVFSNDLDKLFTDNSPDVVFKIIGESDHLPPILNSLMCGIISPETYVILDRFIGFSSVFDTKLSDDYIWSKYRMLTKKLHPFLMYDKNRMRTILKEKIHEYGLSKERFEESRAPKGQGSEVHESQMCR
jgi:hypothetical protein